MTTDQNKRPTIPRERSTLAAKLILSMGYMLLILSFSAVSKAWAATPSQASLGVIPKIQSVIPKHSVIPKLESVIPKQHDHGATDDYLDTDQLV